MLLPQTKVCTKCGEEKSLDHYGVQRSSKDGLRHYCKQCHRNAEAERYAADPERFKERASVYRLKSLYGLTEEALEEMWEAQQGCCVICNKSLARGSSGFAVDHNHATGAVRALLCPPCNRGLGIFRDSPTIIDRAAEYLRTYGFYGPKALEGAPAPT